MTNLQAEREADQVASDVMQGGELGVDSMRRTDVHVQRMVGGLTVAGLGTTAAKLKGNRDERLDNEQSQAESYANMGQTSGSTEDRLDALETQVSQLGQYVSEQVAPTSVGEAAVDGMKGRTLTDTAKTSAALALGTGAVGATGGVGLLALAAATGATGLLSGAMIGGASEIAPDVKQTATDLKPDWLSDTGENWRERLPNWLGGRADADDHSGDFEGLA